MRLLCPAKINLFLDVLSKRTDNYHNIVSVMQTVSLYDEIIIENSESGFSINCEDENVPKDNSNIVYSIFEAVKKKYQIQYDVEITIKKSIPIFAGLGGGSSNGAAVLIGLNQLWKINMSSEEMVSIGSKVGADIPFFLTGGTVLAEGIGEKLTKLNDFFWKNILIVKPEINISTKETYSNLAKENFGKYDSRNMINMINNNRYKDAASGLYNVLEKVSMDKHKEIHEIKTNSLKSGASASLMSGSGSAVFSLFEDKEHMENFINSIEGKNYRIYKVQTVKDGIICMKN